MPRRWIGLVGLALVGACTRLEEPENGGSHRSAYFANSPPVCGVDEVREYFCDELLPMQSAEPAPPPHDNCPGAIDSHFGEIAEAPPVAVFDPSYTEHIRARQPPGHSCCYSWCSPVLVVDPKSVDPSAGCASPRAFRETYCLDEPEAGTSFGATAPYDACPAAIEPPEGAVFEPVAGARFDPVETGNRRQLGFRECCYAWCSVAPRGTRLAG